MTNSMLLELARRGSKDAEEKLISHNKPLVMSIAKRFLGRGLDMDDVFQLGCVGMLKAIRNFDASYNVAFSTYAVPLITGEIKRYFRDNSYIKVSRSTRELAIRAFAVRDKILMDEGREATIGEIAKQLNSDVESVITAMESQSPPEYLYAKSGDTDMYIIDAVTYNLDTGQSRVDSLCLDMAIDDLSDDERLIIRQRYYVGKTQSEVAKELGVSQVQISRKEKMILAKLRNNLA